MPYIKKEDREKFLQLINEASSKVDNAGDINYLFTSILHKYIEKKGLRYANLNEVVGALECCKLEFYRMIAANYETEKYVENGLVGILPIEQRKASDNVQY